MTKMCPDDRYARIEDLPLLKGEGRFVDDIHLPGMLEIAFVRSPHPHARINGVDTTAARALPGVKAVFVHDDVAADLTSMYMPGDQKSSDAPAWSLPVVLPKDEVCFVGEAVAIVVADNRYIAEDAVALVDVDYDFLPAVSDCRQAIEPGSPLTHLLGESNVVGRIKAAYGDCAPCFDAPNRTVRVSLKQHRGGAHPIEGRGAVADYKPQGGTLTVWSSTQKPHKLRNVLTELFDADEKRLRVITPDVGGGFGAKAAIYAEEILTTFAARRLGRPVKWIEDRREHFLAAIQERDQYWELEAAVDETGRIQALRGSVIHDQGAYTLAEFNIPFNCAYGVPGPYIVPNYRVEVTVVETNKVGTVPVRGAGFPEANFAMERLLERIAAELALDRAEVRQRNLVPADRMPYEVPMNGRDGKPMIYESGDFPASQAKAVEAGAYLAFEAKRAAALAEGRYIGIGIANMLKTTGRGPFESGAVRVSRSGKVTVSTGAVAMGQGLKTFLAQICAEELGLSYRDVHVIAGDTSAIPHGIGGFASRQAVTAGSAVHVAAREVRAKAIAVAAHILKVPAEDLTVEDACVRALSAPDRRLSLGEIAKALSGAKGYPLPAGMAPGLEAVHYFEPTSLVYSNGCHVAEVEVDIDTGAVRIERYVVVNDSGRIVNPVIAAGQLRGGVVHGIGNALFEWMGYDQDAQPVVTTFAEYLLPTSSVVPNIEIHLLENPTPKNPIGVKGIGESGTIAAVATIISAVENALAPFGVEIAEAPITPARLVELIHADRTSEDDA